MKINFRQFKTKAAFGLPEAVIDVREALSQHLYTKVTGERAYDLAYLISQSETGIVDLNDQQVEMLRTTARQTMTGLFYDSLLLNLEQVENGNQGCMAASNELTKTKACEPKSMG